MLGIISPRREKRFACYFCPAQAYMNLKSYIFKFWRRKMTTHAKHHIPWYLWPFAAIWKLLAVIVELTGRLVAMILGIVLIIVGVLVSLTIVGAIVGVPLAFIGLLLFLKGIF